jgi:hypothetical protein
MAIVPHSNLRVFGLSNNGSKRALAPRGNWLRKNGLTGWLILTTPWFSRDILFHFLHDTWHVFSSDEKALKVAQAAKYNSDDGLL